MQVKQRRLLTLGIAVAVSAGSLGGLSAEDHMGSAESHSSPADQKQQPTEDVVKELMQKRREPSAADSTRRATQHSPGSNAAPTDPAVMGIAPQSGAQPALRREGEFILSRRGRLARSAKTGANLFVFDADAEQSPEPPMILLPCQMTQSIEDLVQERGDQAVFILSGQVFTYRGANHLLPTMMKLAINRGNLRP